MPKGKKTQVCQAFIQAHFLEHCWLLCGVHVEAIWGAKCATRLILGALGLAFGTLLLPLIFQRFFKLILGSNLGGGGRVLSRERVPAPVFLQHFTLKRS